MKRLLVIIVIFQFLGAYRLLPEAAKIPFLISHYLETERDHNFLEFLKEHYTAESEHHGQGHNHQNLPFKNSDDGNSHRVNINYYSDISHSPELKLVLPVLNRSEFYPDNFFYSPSFSNTIWQPPRIV